MQQKIIIYTTGNNETLVTRSFAVAKKHLDTLLEKAIEGDRICQSWKIYGNQKLPNYGEWKVCECRIEKDGYFNWTHKMTDKAYRSTGDTYRSLTAIRNA